MMMIPREYNEVEAANMNGYGKLPAGGYVCDILYVEATKSHKGEDMIVISVDICEGEYKDWFSHLYERSMMYNPSTAKWSNGAKYYRTIEGKGLPFFKGMIKAIEESNPNFHFNVQNGNWNEQDLKGMKIGCVFGEEKYIGNDGKPKSTVKIIKVRNINGVENEVPPAVKDRTSQTTNGYNARAVSDEDIPF